MVGSLRPKKTVEAVIGLPRPVKAKEAEIRSLRPKGAVETEIGSLRPKVRSSRPKETVEAVIGSSRPVKAKEAEIQSLRPKGAVEVEIGSLRPKPIWEATFAQRFSPTRCNLVREPRPLGKRFTSATTRNFRIVKSSSGQAGISVKKMTPWHKEHSDGLRSQDHILRTQARLCARPVPLKSRVFLTRNKLICEPGHIGKRTHPCTTWNSRIAKNLSGSAGILIGKLPSNGPKTPRWTLLAGPYLTRVQARIPANPEPCKNRQRKLSDGTKNVKIRHRELGQICARTGTRFEKKRAGSKTHFFSRTAAFARRVFPARNKLIREPGCVGKIMTPATSWNSRFADSIPRLTGIRIGKVHKNSSDTPTSGSHNSLVRTPIRANFISLERGRRELSDDMPHDPF
uniref:Uncharacterized protein n=1 Tax=Fagus sylvatica TaxID=28930 RepID=A0A2N9IM30_FAGSY